MLAGVTRGYTRHPQLARFRGRRDPVAAIDRYLSRVLDEAIARGYSFNASKIRYRPKGGLRAPVTDGQLALEWRHLLIKLARRDPARFRAERHAAPEPHPCFRAVRGPVADWEHGGISGASSSATPTISSRPKKDIYWGNSSPALHTSSHFTRRP